jgi:hypothetical protein
LRPATKILLQEPALGGKPDQHGLKGLPAGLVRLRER